MKKILKKFRYWLIKKLGGFVEPPVEIKPQIVVTAKNPVIITANTKVDALMWKGYSMSDEDYERFRKHVMGDLRRKLCDSIFENEDVVKITYCNDFRDETIDIRAMVSLYEFD